MSYNIDSCDMLANDNLRMSIGRLRELSIQLEDHLPEDNFLASLNKEVTKRIAAHRLDYHDNVELPIDRLTWRGEGSGHSFNILIEKIVPHLFGSADVVFIWEGGDSITGLRIVNGVATTHEVIKSLGKQL